MGNGWHEWPLVLFTVLGQCVVGATIVSGLGWLALGDQREARRRLVRNMFFIWLLMGIGFLASVMHLGSPLRAFNSLNRIGASALSNEIASGALFFAVGGFWWLLAVLEKMPATLGKVWLAIAMLLGLLFVLAMTRVYQINTVPTWYNGYTTSAFFLTVLLSGPLFAALLLRLAKVDFNGWFFAGLSVAALVISAAVIIMQSAGLSTLPQLGSAGGHPAARLRQTPGATPGTAGAGPRLLAMSADPPPAAARYGAADWPAAGLDRRMYWPRPVLWSAYDRRYGGCRLMRRRAGARRRKE
ncbi:anaerobic dimethyl sulfoxide reductase subunit C [Klebsiella pneumoniae subsp. ozaenae]|uniref:Anaerobic dimethyl sulfoxide reductase subunit C n=1 Tax=Klebsiella pneumoniae subsp. ozaenae TaxID=574 RepID=A0A378B3Q2_KLEPO|nr:anaerobic dimethyl sulfoxide reductase subunit C [Klebsiella pneumoniae subsp. ozaenae]